MGKAKGERRVWKILKYRAQKPARQRTLYGPRQTKCTGKPYSWGRQDENIARGKAGTPPYHQPPRRETKHKTRRVHTAVRCTRHSFFGLPWLKFMKLGNVQARVGMSWVPLSSDPMVRMTVEVVGALTLVVRALPVCASCASHERTSHTQPALGWRTPPDSLQRCFQKIEILVVPRACCWLLYHVLMD